MPLVEKHEAQLPDKVLEFIKANRPCYPAPQAVLIPVEAFLSQMMISDSETVFMKEAMLEAIMLTSRAGLACRLFKSRNGGYPETDP